MKDCVQNIKNELNAALDELENGPSTEDPLLDMTEEECKAMYERIRAELVEELKQGAEKPNKENLHSAEQLSKAEAGSEKRT